ncbi:HEAT repeat domain-containing protein [Streptomyces sp. NEAU-NA10]|uniref:HEAT repeat domain-containing protein n=1 Tax=Streptomyces sp. NEAU-NA10 TaxID=3416050 RepID=UPI003CC58C78
MATDGVEQVRAYGAAGDVSGLLRAMESEDAEVREEAMQWLWPAAWNENDLAVATARAVPRLARLALEGPGHREDLLRLLGSIATRPEWPDAREPAQQAVADELPPLLSFAHDADTGVRDAMVTLIAACGREDDLPLLRTRLDRETDPLVRAHVVTALGLLDPGDGAWRHALLDDPEPRVALAAAEDLLRTAELPLPEPLVDHCARAYTADPHEPDPAVWPHSHTSYTDRLLADPEAALRATASGVPLAFDITAHWRDREADVLPWALRETREGEYGMDFELNRLAQLTCALPPELHAPVRDHALPHLASDLPEVQAAAITALARAKVPRAVEEAVRLVEEVPGSYRTARTAAAVAEEFGAGALEVARAVARRLGTAHSELVKVLTRFPEVAVDVVDELTVLLARTGTGHPPVAVAVLGRLGPAAGDLAERALLTCVTERAHSSVSAVAAVAYHRVSGDPGPALSFFRQEMTVFGPGLTMDWASQLGPAAAPLLPFIDPCLTRDGRPTAALAVWRITGRTEDTVEPLARQAVEWGKFYAGTPHPVLTLTEMGLLPRFAVGPLRRGVEAPHRVVHDFMTGDSLHADYVARAAVRNLLETARILD